MGDDDESNHGMPIEDLLAKATPPSAFQSKHQTHFIPIFKYPLKLQDFESNLQNLDYARLMGMENVTGELRRVLNSKQPEDTEEDDILYDPIYENLLKNRKIENVCISKSAEEDRIPIQNITEENGAEEVKVEPVKEVEEPNNSDNSHSSTSDLEDWLDSVL